ncbi:hypothetical protein ONZ51_g7598 [Trametes cubensis]|uniref:DUF6533 domain-containing protein n=1 Tax=Trametes cubensis TaxID=1111947 RepID=A0AAD7TPW3_9APHY|nr:hypothetical protein ONZ51_g7598 [Trametes cubensis]
MSASDAYAAEIKTLINETYYTLAAFALLSFEYVITFDREVRLVWGRKVTGATVLYVLNRYWLFLEYITQVVTTFPISEKLVFSILQSCDVVGYMVIVGNAGPPFIWAAFSALRGYALSGRKSWVALIILLFYVPHIALTCSLVRDSNAPAAVTIASRTCLIVGDLIVLAVTWQSTFNIARAARMARMRVSLTYSILTDGTLYFVCLLILNVVNIVVNVVNNDSAVSAFQDPITSILVSRFLLNLRDVHDTSDTRPSFVQSQREGATHATTVQFAEFVRPMGADLAFDDWADRSTRWSDEADEFSTENELSTLSTARPRASHLASADVLQSGAMSGDAVSDVGGRSCDASTHRHAAS